MREPLAALLAGILAKTDADATGDCKNQESTNALIVGEPSPYREANKQLSSTSEQ